MRTNQLTAEQNSILADIFGSSSNPYTRQFITDLQKAVPTVNVEAQIEIWSNECLKACGAYNEKRH